MTSPSDRGSDVVFPEIIGDGSDGDVTIAGAVTLTRDMQYNVLTISVAGALRADGFRVMARKLVGNGVVFANPGNGAASGTAGGGYANAYRALAAGAGGTAAGTPGPAGSGSSGLGGAGGAGGLGSGGAGGAAGAASSITAPSAGVALVDVVKINPLTLWRGQSCISGVVPSNFYGGNTGGGGGGDGTAGGGGGGGACPCIVFAYDATAWTGTIRSNGGSGGTPAAGNRGGGGGGGGGFAALVCSLAPSGIYVLEALGGAAGTASGTGVVGGAGSVGTTLTKIVG